MNELLQELLDKPSIESPWCPFCGKPFKSRHHIVPRSQGGSGGPTVTVCGIDNVTGCHGDFHQHMKHLRWNNGWEYLSLKSPIKYETALEMDGWKRLPNVPWTYF